MDLLQNTSIKRLTIKNFEELKMFHVKHFENYRISDSSFKAYLTQNQYEILAMFHVKHLIGYGIFLKTDFQADIIYIATHPEYRRRGVASKILNFFELNKNDFDIFLEVDTKNLNAISFYMTHEFKTISVRKKYLNGKDAYLMSKRV